MNDVTGLRFLMRIMLPSPPAAGWSQGSCVAAGATAGASPGRRGDPPPAAPGAGWRWGAEPGQPGT